VEASQWQVVADAVLVVHCAIVLFIVGGLVLIIIGNRRGWGWVNRFGFRVLHVVAILVVVAEAWCGVTCPLTVLENALRERAGASRYDSGLIAHWVGRCLFYDAPAWIFVLAYSAFAVLVLAVWWRHPPRSSRSRT